MRAFRFAFVRVFSLSALAIATALPAISQSVSVGNNAGGSTNQLYLAAGDPNHYIYSSGSGGNSTFFGEYNVGGSTGWHFIDTASHAEMFTALASGNFGIGNVNPASKLEVQTVSNGLNIVAGLRNGDSTETGGNAVGLGFLNESDGDWWKAAIVHERTGSYGIGKLHFLVDDRVNNSPVTLAQARMTITQDGKVGIGTTSPGAPLSLEPGNAAGPLVNTNDGNTYITVGPWKSAGGHDYRIGIDGGTLWFGAWNNYRWYRTQTGGVDMVLNNGYLGIGTTNPTYPLTVNGAIRAKEVIVDTGWSDYVFDEHYKLAPLSEVESHIKAEKHLPGIPSAQEVAAQGISVGEMQAKLLAKIEELTLHVIEQGKQISAVSAENAVLRHELETLKQSH